MCLTTLCRLMKEAALSHFVSVQMFSVTLLNRNVYVIKSGKQHKNR